MQMGHLSKMIRRYKASRTIQHSIPVDPAIRMACVVPNYEQLT